MSLLAEKLYMVPISLENNPTHSHCCIPLLNSSASPPKG